MSPSIHRSGPARSRPIRSATCSILRYQRRCPPGQFQRDHRTYHHWNTFSKPGAEDRMGEAVALSDIDLTKSENFVDEVPHHWFAELRREAPVWWNGEDDGPGFWAVTKYDDCVAVNRDYEHFSSARKATFLWEIPEDALAQQQLMMLNMDPPLHTRYRRLVNKGFTPRMVNQLEAKIHETADQIIDTVIERSEERRVG